MNKDFKITRDNHQPGIVEIPRGNFCPAEGTDEWHKQNLAHIPFWVAHELNYSSDRLYYKNYSTREAYNAINYWQKKYDNLKLSTAWFLKKHSISELVIMYRYAILSEFKISFFLKTVKRKYKMRLFFYLMYKKLITILTQIKPQWKK